MQETESKMQLKEKECALQNEGLEVDTMHMMRNLENLLKESHKREEKYFKLLLGTWVVFGCILIMVLKMI